MNKKRLLLGGGALLILVLAFFVWNRDGGDSRDIWVPVEKGTFEITVSTSGELDARNSVRITGPNGMRQAQIWQVQLNKIVPEGTEVEKGEFVAELDKSGIMDKLRERESELTQAQSQFEQTQLDTTLTLREARDNLKNLSFSVEEKKLELEQSAYEPPATIKKVEIELEKARRQYKQAQQNYEVKVQQAKAKMREVAANRDNVRSKAEFLRKLVQDFTILAPENGMIIYAKEWNGRKKREGSTISAWNPVVATLPDLSAMISRTYVNEVDIRKIETGQTVEIGLDAFPDKKLTGEVTSVANMGEQKPNSDAKVFEVSIRVNEKDATLRPSMTTSNTIYAEVIDEALSVPLEALHSQGDSITFVYRKEDLSYVKQQVKAGKTNDRAVIIEAGLTPKDEVMLSTPSDPSGEIVLLSGETTDVAAQ